MDDFGLNAILSCDTSGFEEAMKVAASEAKIFQNDYKQAMQVAARAGTEFEVSSRKVFQQWKDNQKDAMRAAKQELKDYEKELQSFNNEMNKALKPGRGGIADSINRANKDILKMANPNAGNGFAADGIASLVNANIDGALA